jgi:3-oxoacyl-[acyl-carrier-protein] synthase II
VTAPPAAVLTGIGWAAAGGLGRGRGGGAFSMEAGALPALSRKDVFDAPNPRFGRMSEYSKLGVAAVAFALRDAGLDPWDAKRPIGLAAGSELGCLATDLDFYDSVLPAGGGLASPALFAYTLANCFLGEAAILFGLTGPGIVLTEGPGGDRLDPLRAALEWLDGGECGAALAGCCDFPPAALPPGVPMPLPGSLFLALERSPSPAAPGYGTLALSADGTILLDGAPAAGLLGIVRDCLTSAKDRIGSRP